MQDFLSVEPWGFVLAALLILTVPLPWLCSAALAALIHECFHILAILLCGYRVLGIRLRLGGAEIDTDLDGGVPELLCAIAGPAGSLLLLTLCHRFPILSLCGAAQGLFNLLPVYPLDGGRAMLCLIRLFFPEKADVLGKWIFRAVFAFLSAVCIYGTICLSLGFFPIILLLILLINAFLRKRPCKQRQIRVQ